MVQTKARMLRLDEVTYQRLKFLAGDGSMGGLVRSWVSVAAKEASLPVDTINRGLNEEFASSPMALIANALVGIDEKLGELIDKLTELDGRLTILEDKTAAANISLMRSLIQQSLVVDCLLQAEDELHPGQDLNKDIREHAQKEFPRVWEEQTRKMRGGK